MSIEFEFVPAVLPIAPRPMSDELISSWLHRTATANKLSFGELIESARSANIAPLAGALDHDLPAAWRARLASFCRVRESRISFIDLRAHFPHRNLAWFTHTREFYPSPGEPAVQLARPFCMPCGEEQRALNRPVYIRAHWTLAFRTHCLGHLSPLIDRCCSCGMITFSYWCGSCFCCERCHARLRATHAISDSPALRRVVRLQETMYGCLHGCPPQPCGLGPVSATRFLQVVLDLVEILLHRIPGSRFILADVFVPDEFRLSYTVGGRFDDPRLPNLPWFGRFLILSALDRILHAVEEAPNRDRARTVGYLLRDFLASLPLDERAGILTLAERWPSALTTLFHHPARDRRRSSRSPAATYNTSIRF
jgi:hypothetical protein